jgi:hypothetical protein
MKEWLRETHGPGFELLRHFLLRFFDSDLISVPDHWVTTAIGAFSVVLPWFPLFAQPLRHKYAYFSGLPFPGPYRQAVRSDELWLLTLMMSAIGLLTAIKWQSLFPGLGDYRALGGLPLKARQIFLAKLLALLLVATASAITLNFLPGLMFPLVSSSRWQINPSLGAHLRVHALAFTAACYWVFFGLVALQGMLLNLLRPRAFGRVSGYMQGGLVALMLILLVLSFSIQPQTSGVLTRPEVARWLPPVWFLGLYQNLLGDPDPAMQNLAHRALAALAAVVALALLTYLISYRRHRELLVEGPAGPRDRRLDRCAGTLLAFVIPEPRQQAILVFMAKTLARSSQHRMILMGYCGFGAAIILSVVIGMRDAFGSARGVAAGFVSAHVIFLIFLLIGLRHLFSIPVELGANWTFQITEREGRIEWLHAVDRFVLLLGAAVVIIPLPLEAHLLGWRALQEAALFVGFGLLCHEWVFRAWEKLPFTCSHLPAKTPVWIMVLQLLGLLTALPVVNLLLLESLHSAAFLAVQVLLLAAWMRMRATRREGWGELRLTYREAPDPAIHGLNLMR